MGSNYLRLLWEVVIGLKARCHAFCCISLLAKPCSCLGRHDVFLSVMKNISQGYLQMANTVDIAGKRSERSSQIAHCKTYSIELIAPPEFVLLLSIRTSQSDQPNRIVRGVESGSGHSFSGGFQAHRFG